MRIAVIDDYQGTALTLAGWSKAAGVTVVPFRDHVGDVDGSEGAAHRRSRARRIRGRAAAAGASVPYAAQRARDVAYRLVTKDNYRTFFRESLENLVAYLDGKPIRTITAARPFLPESQVARQTYAAGNV